MKKNKWFEDVFLPSLFERAKNNVMWLSAKQTQVCVENFDSCETVRVEAECGYYRRKIYKHTWQNRPVSLYYSKLNGCGQILDAIENIIEDMYPDGADETTINDLFWFEDDTIAEWLGYNDFEEIINR